MAVVTLLENLVQSNPTSSLAHSEYGRHYVLENGFYIYTSPSQRLRSFVDAEGSPCRFIVVGQLASFKIVEHSVRVL
jgi:hypothetical protein